MRTDLQIGGVLISPFVAYALGAFAILVLLRTLFARVPLGRYVANAAGGGRDLRLHSRPAGGSDLMADEDDPKAGRPAEQDAARDTGRAEPAAVRDAGVPRHGRVRKLLRFAATAAILAVALAAAAVVWHIYVTAPWTRDGRVRVQVAPSRPRSRARSSR